MFFCGKGHVILIALYINYRDHDPVGGVSEEMETLNHNRLQLVKQIQFSYISTTIRLQEMLTHESSTVPKQSKSIITFCLS